VCGQQKLHFIYDDFALNVTAVDGWRFSAVFKPWIGNGVFLISLSREITFFFCWGEVVGGFHNTARVTGTIFHFSNKNE
jgi:hypothetical protein